LAFSYWLLANSKQRSRERDIGSETSAIEANGAEFLMAFGRAAGAEVRDDGRVRWAIGNSPIDYFNCVVYAELTVEEADREIESSIERMRAHAVPGSWHVGPSMRPPDLGARLVAHSFVYGGDDIGMAIDLQALPEDILVPADFAVERVRDEAGLGEWAAAFGPGFGIGPAEAGWIEEMFRRMGFEGAWRYYLGRLAGEPVATSALFFAAGVAGVYCVSTIQSARRRGIGAVVTLAALREARDLGYGVGVLTSSEMGYSVYRRLGFVEYCRIGLYQWSPG
jgi:GNAT superfamily N-acetyltransferase